jgi:hypothetical protein
MKAVRQTGRMGSALAVCCAARGFCPARGLLGIDAGGRPFPPNCRIPGSIDFDLTGTYRVTDHCALIGVIQNLLDRPPTVQLVELSGN